MVSVPHRDYVLYAGSLKEVEDWLDGAPQRDPVLAVREAAFVWPADQAWCIANDFDTSFATIGSSDAAGAELRSINPTWFIGTPPS